MALFRPAAPIEAVRGSVGRTVFRTALTSGSIAVRRSRRPRQTPGQRVASTIAKSVHKLWADLGESGRQDWRDFAANAPLLPPPDGEPYRSGLGMFLAANGRLLTAGRSPILVPASGLFFAPDPPWLKILPTDTPGVADAWWFPQNTAGPATGQVYYLAAGKPRPATRRAYRRDETFHSSILGQDAPQLDPGEELDFRDRGAFGPGTRLNVRSSTIDPSGAVSLTYGYDVQWPPEGRVRSFAAYNFLDLSNTWAIALDPAGLALAWRGNYPAGPPDVLDLTSPSTADVADCRDHWFDVGPFDTITITGATLSRPWTDLIPFAPRRVSVKQGLMLFTVPE